MDMHVGSTTRCIGLCGGTPSGEYDRLAEHRRQLFALIGEFRVAVTVPGDRRSALRLLKEILPCSDAYFNVVESLLDKLSAAGAAPHRDEHHHIVNDLRGTLERCSSAVTERLSSDLVHALDALVMHEATIRLRAPEYQPLTHPGATALPF